MKNLLAALFLCASLSSCAGVVATTNISYNTPSRIVTIPKNHDGGWYKPKHNLKAGDTVLMTGDYAYIYLDSVRGEKGKEIVFINSGIVRAGVNGDYGWIITNSQYFKVIGKPVGNDPYGIKIGGLPGKFIAQGFSFPTSDNLELYGLEVANSQVGFFANPKTTGSGPFKNIKIHGCYIHTLNNPAESGRSECFYIGRTDVATRTEGGAFENVEICNNILENIWGDGIQIAICDNANVHDNTIHNYGQANLVQQRTAIIMGGCTNGTVKNNIISKGTGAFLQIFGGGDVYVEGNKADSVATSENEDGIYINGKCKDGLLRVYLIGNTIKGKVNRQYVLDATNSIIENKNNTFGNTTPTPIPTPVPTPVPTKKVIKTFSITVYDDGTYEVK